jgi:uncharacterized protein
MADPTGRETSAPELVAEMHRRQSEMYTGGSIDAVAELLAEDIVWHVPGTSQIAGDHRGKKAVVEYFETRRRLASSTMSMHPGRVISEGDAVVQLIEGRAVFYGKQVSWQTTGIYRVDPPWVREAWLVPLDLDRFDRIWSARS